MTKWTKTLNELIAETETMLSNATDEGLEQSMIQVAMMDADDLLKKSHADRTLIIGMASLAFLYLLNRREETKA